MTLKKTKCLFEGNIFKKGEKITPDGTCIECICDERLKTQDLDIHTPQCQRKQCAIGVNGQQHDYLNRGCVPVYDKTATICCPIEWRCRKFKHSNTDTVFLLFIQIGFTFHFLIGRFISLTQ